MERLKEVEAAVNVQTMKFLEKKRNQLQDEVDAWEERRAATATTVLRGTAWPQMTLLIKYLEVERFFFSNLWNKRSCCNKPGTGSNISRSVS